MASTKKTKEIWEYGDFQTPDDLAIQVAAVLQRLGINPASVIEPTCGKGSLFMSAIKAYPHAKKYIGVDINANHLRKLQNRITDEEIDAVVDVLHGDFFEMDWTKILSNLPQPILVIGNPPWVTSSQLSLLQSANLPEKSNFQGRSGLEALTGKSNFDISEWILLQNLAWLDGKNGAIAMLCKTAVARKILAQAWQKNLSIESASMFKIDAKSHFGAAVDACLLVMELGRSATTWTCSVFESVTSKQAVTELGFQDSIILSNMETYQNLRHLRSEDTFYTWRSGVKHDSSKLMELVREGNYFVNGHGDTLSLEDEFVYPLLKSSDIGNGRTVGRKKYMLVTQKYIGEDTNKIKTVAPKTWDYLQSNKESFAKRGSSIYRNRPDFSVFGVGDYTFSPWKVAISGFYKRLNFVLVPPIENKPVVFDDTVYFLPCSSDEEARFMLNLLESDAAKSFLDSMIFWEDKRPITVDVLKRLNLQLVARLLNKDSEYLEMVEQKGMPNYSSEGTQLRLLEKRRRYNG